MQKTVLSAEKEFQVTKGYSYYVFFLLFLLYIFNYIDRMVIASLLPYIKAEWTLTDAQTGWFASIVTLMMTLFVFPAALLVDRWSRKKAIAIMGILWGIASALCGFAQSFINLILMRSAVGVGEAAYSSGGTAMISAYFPEEKRATLNGLFTAGIPLGTALGMILGGIIAVKFGWRYAFGIVAIPGLIVAILFFWVKDYKTVKIANKKGEAGASGKVQMGFVDIAKEFLHTPSVLLTYVGYVGNTFVTTGLMNWLPTYYNRTEGLPMDKAGMKSAIIFLVAIIGAPIGGLLIDRLRRKWIHARMSIPAITSLLMGLSVFIAFSINGPAQYYFLLLFGLTAPMFAAGGASVTQDVVHPGLRAISYSLAQFFMMLLGYTLSPIFIGIVSDRYDLQTAFKFLPLFALLGSIAFFIGAFFYERDLRKVERVKLKEAH